MPSIWTLDSLKEYADSRFDSVRDSIHTASVVAERRAEKLETATQARFESVNEFRAQTKDLQASYMPRQEFDSALESLNEKINAKNIQIFLSLGVGFTSVLIAVFNFASS